MMWYIRVIDDMAEVHRLQSGSKGWDDDMALVSYVALSLPACLHPQHPPDDSCV